MLTSNFTESDVANGLRSILDKTESGGLWTAIPDKIPDATSEAIEPSTF